MDELQAFQQWLQRDPYQFSGAPVASLNNPLAQVTPNSLTQESLFPSGSFDLGSQGGYDPSVWDRLFGNQKEGVMGGLLPAVQAGTGLANSWMAFNQLGLAKDMFKQGKREFAMNWDAQKKMTNSRLEDRQRARLAAGDTNVSEAEYMAKWGIA